MVRRSTWIVLAVFVLLAVVAWLLQRFQAKKAEIEPTATPTAVQQNLYNLTGKSVVDIKISDSTGNQIDLYKDSVTSLWAIADRPAEEADSFKIESVSAQLYALQAQEYLDISTTLASVGLVTPTYTITMTTSDGGQLITYVGNQTAIGSGYYVRVGSGPIVIVGKVTVDEILDLLKNPPLLATPTPEVTETETPVPTETETPTTSTPYP